MRGPPCDLPLRHSCDAQRKESGEVRTLSGCVDFSRGDGIIPDALSGGEGEPGRRIHLDDVGRGSPGVTRTRDALHGAERRHTHFDRVARRPLGEQLQQVAHRGRERIPVGCVGERIHHSRRPDVVTDPCACHGTILPKSVGLPLGP